MSRRQPPRAAAGWSPLPKGRFTGIDWSAPGAFTHSDPYLAWAETSGFAGFRPSLQEKEPPWLPLIIELNPGCTLDDLLRASDEDWMQVPRIYQQLPLSTHFCTARVRKGFFRHLGKPGPLRDAVARYELGLPVGPFSHALPPQARARLGNRPVTPRKDRVAGPVMAIIDSGLAVGHVDFLDAQGRSRVAAYWRQDETQGPHGRAAATRKPVPLDPYRAGPMPDDIGYGHELDQKAINQAILRHTRQGRLDEDALYQWLQMWELNHNAHHGTHVSSLAAGPTVYAHTLGTEDTPPDWQPAHDPASRAALVIAQLDWASIADTSGGAVNVSVLDALAYVLTRCADEAAITVNLSWGTLAGPHNGSSVLEAAMDQWLQACQGRLTLVMPAGNAYQARTHANQTLDKGQSLPLHWRVLPDDHSQSFLELWVGTEPGTGSGHPHALADLELVIQPPGAAAPLPPIRLGESGVWPDAQSPRCAVIFPHRSALGHPGTCALVALAPTASWYDKDVTLAPAGRWQVTVTNRGQQPVVVDAYVERDDVALGAPTGARQSYLEDADYDLSGNIGSFIDHPDNPTPIRRSGTFNGLATARDVVTVGGIRYFASSTDPAARYSPRIPDPDASRTERAGVRKLPSRLAISDDHATLWGVRAAGTRSAAAVRLVGTSMAAPQVARDLLDKGV